MKYIVLQLDTVNEQPLAGLAAQPYVGVFHRGRPVVDNKMASWLNDQHQCLTSVSVKIVKQKVTRTRT